MAERVSERERKGRGSVVQSRLLPCTLLMIGIDGESCSIKVTQVFWATLTDCTLLPSYSIQSMAHVCH